jgi:hypothetical protein
MSKMVCNEVFVLTNCYEETETSCVISPNKLENTKWRNISGAFAITCVCRWDRWRQGLSVDNDQLRGQSVWRLSGCMMVSLLMVPSTGCAAGWKFTSWIPRLEIPHMGVPRLWEPPAMFHHPVLSASWNSCMSSRKAFVIVRCKPNWNVLTNCE